MLKSIKLKTLVILLFTFISIQQSFASQNDDFMKAIELLNEGKMDQAELMLEKLSSKSEATPEIFNNLAVIAARKGNFQKAVSLLQVALTKNPSAKITYDNLNKIFCMNEDNVSCKTIYATDVAKAGQTYQYRSKSFTSVL